MVMRGERMIVNVMIEIPKGSRNKYEYDTGKKKIQKNGIIKRFYP